MTIQVELRKYEIELIVDALYHEIERSETIRFKLLHSEEDYSVVRVLSNRIFVCQETLGYLRVKADI